MLPLRVYRHSGPLGPAAHPVHPAHLVNPASDTETQEHREKVWKTLMSIERRSNTEKSPSALNVLNRDDNHLTREICKQLEIPRG